MNNHIRHSTFKTTDVNIHPFHNLNYTVSVNAAPGIKPLFSDIGSIQFHPYTCNEGKVFYVDSLSCWLWYPYTSHQNCFHHIFMFWLWSAHDLSSISLSSSENHVLDFSQNAKLSPFLPNKFNTALLHLCEHSEQTGSSKPSLNMIGNYHVKPIFIVKGKHSFTWQFLCWYVGQTSPHFMSFERVLTVRNGAATIWQMGTQLMKRHKRLFAVSNFGIHQA